MLSILPWARRPRAVPTNVGSEEVSPGIIVDYDEQDRVVGIEMLYLSKRVPETDIHRLLFEAVPQAS